MSILSVDIGGTFIKYALMSRNGNMISRGKIATPKEGRDELVETIGRLFDEMPDVEGIAICMPGIIDPENGYCVTGGALRYNDDFYFRHVLYERCPVRIVMENDAKCAAMAEAGMGALKDVCDGLVLIFGTMIGGGIIHDHRLYRGKHFSAGEVSYIIPHARQRASYDNVWGNLCGTPRLCRIYAERKGLDPSDVDGLLVFNAVNAGEKEARDSLSSFTREIAVQIFNLQTVLDPEKIAIGGGISAQPALIEYIRRHLDQLYSDCPYQIPRAEIVTCKFQNDANLYGALQCYLEHEKL